MINSTIPTSPYIGLIPYSEKDAPLFFGREEKIQVITANLMASRLTLFHGPSGVGKSSVLRAGVAHKLREAASKSLAAGRQPEFAVVVFSSWRDDPVASLAARVSDSVAQLVNSQTVDPLPASRDLTRTLQTWTKQDPNDGRPDLDLLIILDQFEEYFLYHSKEEGDGTFAAELPRAINSCDLRVNFLISIREDALAKLERFKGSIPQLFDNRLSIEHLDRRAARDAIIKPLDQYNKLYLAGGEPFSIEPELVEAVLDQIKAGQVVLTQAGRGTVEQEDASASETARIETPYLQMVMTRLWEEELSMGSRVLRLDTLNSLGGAARIVRTHLDKTMSTLSPEEQDLASKMFYHLVTPSGSKIAHTVPDLAAFAEVSEEQLGPVLLSLSDGRVLRPIDPPPNQPKAQRYEIFHDVLAPAILDWQTRYALAKNQAKAEQRAARKLAEQRKEVERRFTMERQRRMRWALGVLVGLLLLMAAVSAYAFRQQRKANSALAESIKQTQNAKTSEQKARTSEQNALMARAEAVTAQRQAEAEKKRADEQARLATASEQTARVSEQNALKAKADAVAAQQRANREAELARQAEMSVRLTLRAYAEAKAGDTEKAIGSLNQAIKLYHAAGDPSGEADALANIAENFSTLGGVVSANFLRSVLSPDGESDASGEAAVSSYLAILYISALRARSPEEQKTAQDARDSAIRFYQLAIEVNKRTLQRDGMNKEALRKEASMLQRIGDVYFSSELSTEKPEKTNRDRIIEYYGRAGEAYMRAGSPGDGAVLLNTLGELLTDELKGEGVNSAEALNKVTGFFEGAQRAYDQAANQDPSKRALYLSRESLVLVKLGDIYKKANMIQKAIGYYERAAPMMTGPEKKADCYVTIGDLYKKLGNQDKAVENYEEARSDLQKARLLTKDPQKKILLDKELGMVKKTGELYKTNSNGRQKLEEYYDRVVAGYHDDPTAKAGTLDAIGDYFSNDLKDKQKAIEYYDRERQAWHDADNYAKEGDTLVRMGELYNGLSDTNEKKKAITLFEQARDAYSKVRASELDDATRRDTIVSSLIEIGRIYSEQAEEAPALKSSALKAYEQAFSISRESKTPNNYRVNTIVQAVAKILVDLKDQGEASKFFKEVFDYYQNAKDPSGEASAFEVAGDSYERLGKTQEAVRYYNQARLSYQKTTYDQYRQLNILKKIGKVYLSHSDDAGAASYYKGILETYAADNYSGRATALATIGSFYNESGKKQEAIKYYGQASEAWHKAGNRPQEANALMSLSKIYIDLGQKEEADKYAQQAAGLTKKPSP
jgi:tetratricopeptide (TPR) repeat protein